jgi:hypothetical protein
MIRGFAQLAAKFVQPGSGINAVHNPAQETQPLGNIVAVDADASLVGTSSLVSLLKCFSPCTRRVSQTGVLTVFGVSAVS